MKKTIVIVAALVVITSAVVMSQQDRHRDEIKPQKVTCMNNLRAIGLAFREWAGDHNGQYSFNVSTNEGGSKELAKADSQGFATNPAEHFRTLGNPDLLKTPLVLICPKDHNKKPAANWASTGPENLTYKLRVGTNVTESTKQVLAVCPVDGNTLYTDGTVTGEVEPVKPGEPQPMKVQ